MSQLRQLIDNNFEKNSVLAQIAQLVDNATQWLKTAAEPEIDLRNQMAVGNKEFQDIEATLIQATGKSILDNIRVQTYDLNNIFSKANHQQAKSF